MQDCEKDCRLGVEVTLWSLRDEPSDRSGGEGLGIRVQGQVVLLSEGDKTNELSCMVSAEEVLVLFPYQVKDTL